MSRKARIRAAAVAALALAIGLLFATGIVPGTFATFSAETENASSAFGGDWVAAATSIATPVASGNGEYFTWTVSNHGMTAQELYFADQGSTANCTGASYTNAVVGASGGNLSNVAASIDGNTTTPNSNVPAANQGDYICYEIRSEHGLWSTVADVGTAVQVGLDPKTVVNSGAGSGNLVSGNNIKITYNQPVTYSAGAISVVATAGNPGTLTLTGIGTVSGGNITKGGTCTSSAVTGTGTVTLTITLNNNCPSGNNKIAITAGGSGTFTGSGANVTATIGPAGHAYSVNQCTTAAICLRSMSY